ncbi:MAG: type VI secretion system membrane subunit TssM [Saccharospirillum sp.]|uniref:type VI secretion system membrane subunit TssM n=1 Tax=Saccharospirillum sp. TaxID=2033801 RepID=UPI0032998763
MASAMGLLFRFKDVLLSRASGAVVGLVAVLVIIWFAGHHVGLTSSRLKFIAMGVVVVVFLLIWLVTALYKWRRGRKLRKQLDAMSGGSSDAIQSKISDVLDALKGSHLGTKYRGNSALYALPWYMVIGPSAAGKSTLFSQSGLEFPLKDDQRFHVQGIGGTRDCDWWFSDQAILIDTAGRYTSDEDNDDWLSFLRVLKANRSKMPINGLMLALPLDQILTSEKADLELHVKHLKNRLHELISELGVTFPIYIVITKSDLLKGFEAFFSDLSEQEIKQPWGVYLLDETEDKSSNGLAVLHDRLTQLYHRLLEQRTQKVNLAQKPEDKVAIYQFPNQFSGATEKLMELLSLLFKDNPYHESPWFAGVYFTSSTQEGVALERRSNAFKSVFAKVAFAVKRQSELTRSYFIDHLFTEVIFPLQNAVRGNRKRQRWSRAVKAVCFMVISGVVALTGIGLFGTYTSNQMLISGYASKAERLLERYHDASTSDHERLDALVGLHEHYQQLEKMQTYSPLQVVRRYSLVESHAEPMQQLLLTTLTETVEDRIVPELHTQLETYSASWPELDQVTRIAEQPSYYEALRSYLMLTSHTDRQDLDILKTYLSKLWYESYADHELLLSYQQRQSSMQSLIELYLVDVFSQMDESHVNPWSGSQDWVAQAQDRLVTDADAQVIYDRLVASGNSRFASTGLNDVLDPSVQGVLKGEYRVPGAFSRTAWETYIADEIDALAETATRGDWVLGLDSGTDEETADSSQWRQLRADVRAHYFADYTEQWSQFVQSVTVPRPASMADAVQAIKALGSDEAPWTALFDRVALELQITDPAVSNGQAASALVSDLTGDGEAAEPVPVPLLPAFKSAAEPLLAVVMAENGKSTNPAWPAYREQMLALAEEMEFMLAAADIDREAKLYSSDLLSGNASGKQLYAAWIEINALLDAMPDSSRSWVESSFTAPIEQTWSALLASATRSLQQQWDSRVYSVYANNLQGRFPFSSAEVEATPHDVQLLLQPGQGELWLFVSEELESYLQRSNGQWRSRTWLDRGLTFNPQFFDALVGADRLSRGLFKPGSPEMGMGYALYPMPVPGVTEALIEVNGAGYRYRNEPQEWREFNWTLSQNNSQARVLARAGNGSAPVSFEANGQWAFVRLIQEAEVTHLRGTEFELHWEFGQGSRSTSVRFRMRADREGSVLNPSLFRQMALPRSLFRAG